MLELFYNPVSIHTLSSIYYKYLSFNRTTGHPERLRSIEMKIGGRWVKQSDQQIVYDGGYVRYIHNIDPENFSCVEIILSTQMMLLDPSPPSRMWYLPYESEIPSGLVPIDGDDSLRDMWGNCDHYHRWIGRIYMQDVEFMYFEDRHGLVRPLYLLPNEIPRMSRSFDPIKLHAEAMEMHKDLNMLGDPEIGRQELHGERWYIHEQSNPYVPWDPIVKLEKGVTIRFMMKLNHLWHGYYPVNMPTPTCRIGKIFRNSMSDF